LHTLLYLRIEALSITVLLTFIKNLAYNFFTSFATRIKKRVSVSSLTLQNPQRLRCLVEQNQLGKSVIVIGIAVITSRFVQIVEIVF
jgi:hypothetical protein